MKTNTPGETNINNIILKHLSDTSLQKLQHLFSHSLSMGYFPQKFQTATIKLIPKPDTDHTQLVNYRPVSLLEVTEKILKKIINRKLREYLEINHMLPNTQHGFRRGKGTDTATTVAHETIAHHSKQRPGLRSTKGCIKSV